MTTSRDFEIRAAIPRGVVPFYQSIVHLGNKGIVSYEVLGRLEVQGEILAPGQFLPSLEHSLYLAKFDRAILTQAVEQVGIWKHRDNLDVHIHVNASAQVLRQPDYFVLVHDLLRSFRINPKYLTIEVVETCTFWRSPTTLRTLKELRYLGVNIAIDDFPCWANPQALLDWLSANRGMIQVLKLDRSLVMAACGYDLQNRLIDEDLAQQKLNELIKYVDFAHKEGLSIVAEGVEYESQESLLQVLRIDAYQGYLYGKPRPVDQVSHLRRQTTASYQLPNVHTAGRTTVCA